MVDVGAKDETLRRAVARARVRMQLNEFRDAHYRKYPWLHRIRLHWLWTGLHLAIAVYGIVLTILVLVH